jgi:serine/threonine protein kinase
MDTTPTVSAKPKTTLEDFTQLRLLGKGSYGEVYLVEKNTTKEIFALKTMDKIHMAKVLNLTYQGKEAASRVYRKGGSVYLQESMDYRAS